MLKVNMENVVVPKWAKFVVLNVLTPFRDDNVLFASNRKTADSMAKFWNGEVKPVKRESK